MAFRVELSAEAESDADAIAALAKMPARCPLAPESALYPYEVRELRYGRRPHVYRILFSISDDVVQVKHIRHTRRRRLAND